MKAARLIREKLWTRWMIALLSGDLVQAAIFFDWYRAQVNRP